MLQSGGDATEKGKTFISLYPSYLKDIQLPKEKKWFVVRQGAEPSSLKCCSLVMWCKMTTKNNMSKEIY